MSNQQFDRESAARWEYRRAFLLPDLAVSGNLPGDQLVHSMAALEKESPAGWQVVSLKFSTDDRGRPWFDVLLKCPHSADSAEAEPAGTRRAVSLPRSRAA